MPDTQVPGAQALSVRSLFPRNSALTNSTSVAEQAKLDYTCLIVCNDLNIVIRASMPQDFTFDTSSEYRAPFAQGLGLLPGVIGDAAKFVGLQLSTQAMTAQVWQGSSTNQFQIPMIFQVETDVNRDVLEPLMKLMFLTCAREEIEGGLLEAPGPHIDLEKLVKNTASQVSDIATQTNQTFQNAQSGVTPALTAIGKRIGSMVSAATSGEFTQAFNIGTQGALDAKKLVSNVASRPSSALVNSITNNISLYIGRYMYFPSVVIKDVQQTHSVQPMRDGNYSRVECTVAFETFFQPTQRDISTMFPSASPELRSMIDNQASGTQTSPSFQGVGAAPY